MHEFDSSSLWRIQNKLLIVDKLLETLMSVIEEEAQTAVIDF